MSPARKQLKAEPLTIPKYEGLIGRVCGVLGIMPAPKEGEAMDKLRFNALADWCQRKQEEDGK